MATANVVWSGLDEYIELLRTMPESCNGEAAKYVEGNANSMALDVRSAYPARTGNLRDRVEVFVLNRGPYGTVRQVKNLAPHSHLFENGTQARHTELGASRGSMPPGHVFIPRAIKWRRRLIEQVKDMLRRRGAVVTGDAG